MIRDHLHVGPIIFDADMFEHSQGDNVVIFPGNITIIFKLDLHGQSGTEIATQVHLFFGNSNADDVNLIFFRGKFGKTAPAAADVQDGLPGLEPQFAADQIKFGLLGFIEVAGVRPVAAGID